MSNIFGTPQSFGIRSVSVGPEMWCEKGRSIYSFILILGCLVLVFACQQQVEVRQEPLAQDLPNGPSAPMLDEQALEKDCSSIEGDIQLIDVREWQFTQWLSNAEVDSVRKECLKKELQLVNSILVRCQARIEDLLEQAGSSPMAGAGWLDRLQSMQRRIGSRVNAIRSLKEELLRHEFNCEELEATFEGPELDAEWQKAVEQDRDLLRHYRRPSSLYDRLV